MISCKKANPNPTNEYLLKICAIGSGNTGKTLLIRKFAENKFDTNYLPTLGVDITTKKIPLDDIQVKLILVDTAGQEFFGKLRPSYYRGASAAVIVCNINDRNSIQSIPNWLKEFKKHITEEVPLGVVLIEGWKFTRKSSKPQLTLLEPVKFKHRSYRNKKTMLLDIIRSLIVKSTPFLCSTPIRYKKYPLIQKLNSVSHLSNSQLAQYYADFYKMRLFRIRADNCRAISDCFVYLARQVIKN